MLPQFLEQRPISGRDVELGTRQVAWGLFKKIVVADNCAAFVDIIFGDPGRFSSSTLILGAFLFAFQIYCDFSGYSDMAIGLARILGFKLMKNFRQPYFSANIQEFWRRWHISLSTWFRDYLYIPLGGSRVRSAWLKYRNIFITFTVSGLWHGANWQFIV
ncbi:MAG: MBOAT family protein, partial [Pseudomonadales bacterium]|nr:MBOAT family protein [Pseudomonadales bacterium]NIX07779.1 MBOAT family protein [Pseudomonadales bacterium]